MAAQEDDEDEINPFTMLLTNDQDHTPNGFATVHDGAPNKQDHHHLRSIQSTVVIRQLPSEGLSFQLWPAAIALVSLLDHHRIDPSKSPLSATLSTARAGLNDRPLRILELGSGTGIVGIVAAATLGVNVTITDLPHVVPNLQFNADANKGVVGSTAGAVKVVSLRWGHADDVASIGREFDVILASDVVYHYHLYDPLLETLRLMMLVSGEGEERKKMVFLMAHLRRWKKESSFFKKAKKLFDVDVLHTDSPCEGSRVGVIIYRFVRKDHKSVLTLGRGYVLHKIASQITVLVETLDKCFRNVCELDVVFNYSKIHTILDEIIFGGQVLETTSAEVMKAVEEISKLEAASNAINLVQKSVSGWKLQYHNFN